MSPLEADLPVASRRRFAIERWRLLAGATDVAAESQAVQLRAFVHRAVIEPRGADGFARRGAANIDDTFVDVVQPRGAGRCEAMAPHFGVIETPDRIVAFDLESLLWARDYRKAAVLAPTTVPALLGDGSATSGTDFQSDEDHWTFVDRLRDALVLTMPLVVFDRAQARDLAIFGATDVRCLTLPALSFASLGEDGGDACMLVVDHLNDAQLCARLDELLRAAVPQATVMVWASGAANAVDRSALTRAARQAIAHVHVGHGADVQLHRVVDSHAMRKPVVLFQPLDRRLDHNDTMEAHDQVQHLRTGLVASDLLALEAGVRRVVQDTAGVEIFLRNGERVAEALNQTVASELREVLR